MQDHPCPTEQPSQVSDDGIVYGVRPLLDVRIGLAANDLVQRTVVVFGAAQENRELNPVLDDVVHIDDGQGRGET